MEGIDHGLGHARERMRRATALGTTDEVLAQVLADHELLSSADAQRYREVCAIVASSDTAIIGETLDGIVTTWNHGAERLFGYAEHEVLGKSISILIPPGREQEEHQLLERLRRGEAAELETIRRHKDGHDLDISVTISPILDAAGTVVGASKFAKDITDRLQFERELARAKEETETAVRELEAFSYSVAHDLRAPLRGINGFANVLLEDYGEKLDTDGRHWLEHLRTSAANMGSLIDALLSLSRVTRSEIRRKPTDLARLARDAVAELAISDSGRQVELVVPETLEAMVDRPLTRVLIDNLVGNAWKFSARVVNAKIELGVTERDGGPVYFIRDNGAGFDMAHASKLFAAFQRMHTVHEFPGTGIGLATVHRIVRRHGGRIWAEARVGEGATFFFTLAVPA